VITASVALLRAINVGGTAQVAMADLRAMFTGLGFTGVRTLLQSGNVVFNGGARSSDELERLLEAETARRLGLTTDILVRTAEEWAGLIAANAFPAEARAAPAYLHAMCLKAAPASVVALSAAFDGPEQVALADRTLYITYPNGAGRSKLTNTLIERKLGTRGTARNWNTVLKIGALLGKG